MSAISIFLDTEVFRSDPARRSGPLRALHVLGVKKSIALHTSSIVVREFLTSRGSEAADLGHRIRADMRRLRALCATDEEKNFLELLGSRIAEIPKGMSGFMEKEFSEWLKSSGTTVHEPKPEHLQSLVDAYFQGTPPFRRPKSREDFPDALIWQSAAEVGQGVELLYFVSGDKGFKAACDSTDGQVVYFPAVRDLLKSPAISDILAEGVFESQVQIARERFGEWFGGRDDSLSLIVEELLGRRVFYFYPIESDYRIESVLELEGVRPHGDPSYYGDGLLGVRISGRALCEIELPVTSDRAGTLRSRTKGLLQEAQEGFVLRLERTILFEASVLVLIEDAILREAWPEGKVLRALKDSEIALEELAIYWGSGEKKFSSGLFEKHALEVAQAQILAGDEDTAVDPEEEADRIERARWMPVPEHLTGISSDEFTIQAGAEFKIAPMPRFENWVRFLKREFVNETSSEENDE